MQISTEDCLKILSEGQIEVKGEFLWGSNYTFLVQITCNEQIHQAVYKPTRGERPLWDFPTASLGKREVAAYITSSILGWDLVPPTIYRRKGPGGGGSLQWYIDHDPNYHYFNFSNQDIQRLRPVVLFDLLINNADRKGSHVLKDIDGHLWLIDHGISFHVEEKLRTVIWDFVGEPIPNNLCDAIDHLRLILTEARPEPGQTNQHLAEYISQAEIRALARRAEGILKMGRFPSPDPNRRPFPWPQI